MQRAERLVGRHAEVAWIEAGLEVLAAGRSGVRVMTGPAGIGKTRLLDELVARAPAEMLVLRGRASELEHMFPFGVVIDALDDYLRSLAHSPLAEIDPVTD
ncbi:MAG TPA: AAA family ATPase, partial [Nocardioides sp.]|nr:AAA family ATPase [Nocardioides sp.]